MMTSNYQKKIDFVKSISNQLEGTRRFEYVIISKGDDVYEEYLLMYQRGCLVSARNCYADSIICILKEMGELISREDSRDLDCYNQVIANLDKEFTITK
jgi:hypothetical protein